MFELLDRNKGLLDAMSIKELTWTSNYTTFGIYDTNHLSVFVMSAHLPIDLGDAVGRLGAIVANSVQANFLMFIDNFLFRFLLTKV